jgi:hypothetical protein
MRFALPRYRRYQNLARVFGKRQIHMHVLRNSFLLTNGDASAAPPEITAQIHVNRPLHAAIYFGATQSGSNGVANNSALGMRVLDNSGIVVNSSTIIDLNGSASTNQAEWVTSLPGSARFAYLR